MRCILAAYLLTWSLGGTVRRRRCAPYVRVRTYSCAGVTGAGGRGRSKRRRIRVEEDKGYPASGRGVRGKGFQISALSAADADFTVGGGTHGEFEGRVRHGVHLHLHLHLWRPWRPRRTESESELGSVCTRGGGPWPGP